MELRNRQHKNRERGSLRADTYNRVLKHGRISQICITAICAVILYSSQVVLAFLPNFELVSFLVILFTLCLKKMTIPIIAVFVLLEGITYGFGIWWISYIYIWYILALLTYCFRRVKSLIFWAVFSCLFGLSFGALTAIPYLFISNIAFTISYIISGFPFDIAHAAGNLLFMLILFKPMSKLLNHLTEPRNSSSKK